MASIRQSIRSSTSSKRPTSAIADGQIALNTASGTPGLFFKDNAGNIIKTGPAHYGASAPNSSPAVGGSTGNSIGEAWLDNSLTPAGWKVWNGAAWVNATPLSSDTVQGLVELATNVETQAGVDTARAVTSAGLQSKVSDSVSTISASGIASSSAVKTAYDLANAALPKSGGIVTGNLEIGSTGSLTFEGTNADGFETTLTVVDPTADRTITFPNITGNVITTGDTGTVTSTMLLDGTIVDADINASAAIAGTKIAPNFGGQNITTSGRIIAAPSASGVAILQVQTPTTLPTTADNGVRFANTSTKVYPTTTSFSLTAGLAQKIELGTAQTIDTVTPGGFNFVTGFENTLTKSAGNTQDIERLYFTGIANSFTWSDANTCKQYVGFGDRFTYSGFDANSRTSSALNATDIMLACPDTRTQTIATAWSDSLLLSQEGTSTVNITNWLGVSPNLGYYNFSAGTKTSSITNAAFYDTSSYWGVQGTTGTLAATITNLYGLRLRPPIGTTGLTITNNWGLYQEWSSAKNWFAGASNQFPNITTTASSANVFVDSADSNRLYRSTSSSIYKKNVESLDAIVADKILDLRPVWYRSKCQNDRKDWSWYGLIAEEVAQIDPRFVHYGYQEDAFELVDVKQVVTLQEGDPRRENGKETEEIVTKQKQLKKDARLVPNGVAYERLTVPLIDIAKRQKDQLAAQQELINGLLTRVSALEGNGAA
jgi:hypothetical protein